MNKGKGNGQQMKPEGDSVQKPNLHVPEAVDASALLDQLFLKENLDWNAKSSSQENSKSFKTIRKDIGNSYYFELPFDIPQRPRTRSYYSKVIGPPQNPETLIMPAAGTDENSYDCGAPDELQCKEVTIPNTKDNHEEVDMDLDETTFVEPPQPENDNNLLNARIALIHEEFLRGLIK
ncbi:uncharacterized protein LOC111072765 [Drosophila obscura]|uniref:uncharacterized protein LOC111072765 n=1 Tax=Drosophila obscura TaxID=7282 RepID=UPI001BB1D234|nr:uncharacterized protein LOC111072765 [Drosophila obscura]XP_022220513.2 uncharacterized protein LOC111072765 [Drosophila obscura]